MRPSLEEYMMNIADVVSTRSTCSRRKVGAVIIDDWNHILSTGFNGVPSGVEHCTDVPCKGVDLPSGQGLDICKAQHAEVNAITHCHDLKNAVTIFITTSPCMACAKLIAATRITTVMYKGPVYDITALEYLEDVGLIVAEVKQEI